MGQPNMQGVLQVLTSIILNAQYSYRVLLQQQFKNQNLLNKQANIDLQVKMKMHLQVKMKMQAKIMCGSRFNHHGKATLDQTIMGQPIVHHPIIIMGQLNYWSDSYALDSFSE